MRQLSAFYLSGFYLLMGLIWAAPAGAQYLSAAPDIPLAEGLRENPDATLVFDKPQGRILQMSATQAVGANPTRTRQFYTASLPNLGWRARASQDKNILTFTRKGETLRLSFRADTVIFDLTPKAPFED
jgi:hypothetical protein